MEDKVIRDEKMEKYKLLINARNFHYSNFNKWLTFFYIAIGALFVGYYTIITSNKLDSVNIEFSKYILLTLGFTTSLFLYWSSKGYYHWNINFINLVNYYEKNILKFKENERIYFVFANKSTENDYTSPIMGANISTSKIAILFSFIITLSWGAMLTYNAITYFNESHFCALSISILLPLVGIPMLTSIIAKHFLKSNYTKFPDLKFSFDD